MNAPRTQFDGMRLLAAEAGMLILGLLSSPILAAAGFPLGGAEPLPDFRNNYLMIQDRDTQTVVRRGLTGNSGRIFNAEAILAPNKHYKIWIYNPRLRLLGWSDLDTPDAGNKVSMLDVRLGTDIGKDDDGDLLSNEAELVIGTDPNNPDTDGNGRIDSEDAFQRADAQHERILAEELRRRKDPGFVATTPTPSPAVDICTANDLAVVSFGQDGVGIYNIFSGLNPTLIAQVDTPGDARALACVGSRVAVADGLAGLQILDISTPANVRITRSVKLPFGATAVAAAGGIAYAASFRYLSALDLESGIVLEQTILSGVIETVHDLVVDRGVLFLVHESGFGADLRAFDLTQGTFDFQGSVPAASGGDGLTRRKRLAIGDGLAYVTAYNGFEIFDVRQPKAMVKLGAVVDRGPNSFKQIVPNGSGIGIAAAGINPRPDGTHDIYLYDVSQPFDTSRFQTAIATPGTAYAVSVYNGLAYVADGEAGLQVVSYRPLDFARKAPEIVLEASFSLTPPTAEEGKRAWIHAKTRDDIEVRNVEFYLDGIKVATDGNFPFQHEFFTPRVTPAKSSFKVRARASDQGGNTTWTEELTVNLTPDRQPPRVRRTVPVDRSIVGRVNVVSAVFSEPLDAGTITPGSVGLSTAGPDRIFGTADDRIVSSVSLTYREDVQMVILTLAENLVAGRYQLSIRKPLSDRSGNPISPNYAGSFWVLDREDSDGDGLPDAEESRLLLLVDNPDSNFDGVLDGDTDSDGDGLSNASELVLGRDPNNQYSVNPLVKDGDLDSDRDGLTDAQEFRFGTDPFVADTDGDGWTDEQEATAGSGPNNPSSTPAAFVINNPGPIVIPLGNGSDPRSPLPAGLGSTVSQPPVQVTIESPP